MVPRSPQHFHSCCARSREQAYVPFPVPEGLAYDAKVQVPRKESIVAVVELLGGPGTDLAVVDRAIELLVRGGGTSLHAESLAVLCAVTARRSGRAHASVEDAAGW